ncbi:uncharacterized protein [Nicotiana sylvestris]|uniref:uncharacterized protein n=1 Tax=Nicotiana sylvestris TaxID=4096 RepID=UPI00388CDE5A
MRQCSYIKKQSNDPLHAGQVHQPTTTKGDNEAKWIIVSFNKRKNQGRKFSSQPTINQVKGSNGPGISVKLFNANTGKYLDTQLLQYKTKDHSTSNQPSKVTTQPIIAKEQTTALNKNHYLDNRQMVFPKTTTANTNFLSKNKFTQLSDDLAFEDNDTCMSDSNVASNDINFLDTNNAMQNGSLTDTSNPLNNPTPTTLPPPPKQKSTQNLVLSKGLQQDPSLRYGKIAIPMHVGQMASDIVKGSQIATPLENLKEEINCPINQDIEQPKDTKLEDSIIGSSTNPLPLSITPYPTPTNSSLNTFYPTQNAKSSFIPTKEESPNLNPTPTQTPQHGKHSPLHLQEQPQIIYSQPPSPRLPTYQLDGARPHGPCNILHSPNQRSRGYSDPPQHPISSTTHYRGNGVGYEQLPQPSLAQQHYPSNGSIIEPSNGLGNEGTMEHDTPVQPHKPSKCYLGPSLILPWDINQGNQEIPVPPPPPPVPPQ